VSHDILIVDDSLTVRMDLQEAFTAAGLRPTACETLAQAQKLLAQRRFALVLLDVILPDGDGVSLLQQLKLAPATATLPVMMLSSETEVRDRMRGLKTGADEYVGKPYDRSYVVMRARELIRAREGAGSEAAVVLVIDDSVTFREQLRESLERVGYIVVTASSGEDGLRTAVRLRPGAIIVDNVMTGIDGATVIRRVRQDAALRRTPCLLLTASEDRKNEVKALEAGADAYVRKEDDLQVILTRLSAMVRSAGGTRPLTDPSPSFLGPKKIMVVDDSPTFLQELASQLRDENFNVVPVSTGEDALELLALQSVDCILLDLGLPGISGLETCRRVKAHGEWRDIPLLILTARDDQAAMIESINAGADDYVGKSSGFEILKARLRSQLRRKQFEDEARQMRDNESMRELRATEARAARELADTRANLLAELQRKNHELELAKGELEEKNQRVQEANRLKTEFFTNMSHELRTPLNSIIGFSEVLIDGKFGGLNEHQLRYISNVHNSGRHLLRLINDLLDQSKVEAGRLEVMSEACATRQLAEEAVATLQPLADAKHITVRVADNDGRPLPLVSGDVVRLKQVLYNLLANAIKFCPEGGQVSVRSALTRDGKGVRTTVIDSGPGLAPADIARLFTPFTQLGSRSVDRAGGTGLGLALSKKLVELMGGKIGVESVLGQGASFYVDLPLFEGPEREPSAPVLVDPSGPLVLVVDDEQSAQELLELALKRAGYRTVVASSAEQALTLARRERPAVITLDVFLPGIDGWDFLRILRNDPSTADIPVIMVTVSTDRKKAFSLGAVEHLTKPIDQQSLLTTLARQSFTSESKRPVHVLAIDDDHQQLELIRAELEPRGFVVATASTGQAGLDAALDGHFDVLLLDLMLPDVSGVEVVAKLRAAEGPRGPSILLVTGHELSAADRLRLNSDVQAVITKGSPHATSLVDEIDRVLQRRAL
jgi:two-component system, NtrC family, sensor kinase